MGLCISSHIRHEEASLVVAKQDTDLKVYQDVIRCHFIAVLL